MMKGTLQATTDLLNPTQTATNQPAKKTTDTASTKKNGSTQNAANNSNNAQPASATGDANTDLQTCQGLAQTASKCCTDPLSCISDSGSSAAAVAGGQGLTNYCNQMQQANLNGAGTNNQAASVCVNKYTTCMSTCATMAQRYSGQPSVAQAMNSRAESCRSLSSLVSQLTQQSSSNLNAAAGGLNCQQLTQAMPQSTGDQAQAQPQTANDPYGCLANPNSQACLQCAQHPGSPACLALTNANTVATGEADFASNDNKGAGDINLPDNADNFMPQMQAGEAGGTPPSVQTVPNNSGGGIPGQGASGGGSMPGGQAQLGGSGGRSPGSPGYTTDIDRGFRSASGGGGGYAPSSAGSNSYENTGYHGGRRPAGVDGGDGGGGMVGLDLKAYLPGGARDPRGRIGGRTRLAPDINGPFADMWKLISDRIQEKCRLGELYDCR
jgi:hypothetical protein